MHTATFLAALLAASLGAAKPNLHHRHQHRHRHSHSRSLAAADSKTISITLSTGQVIPDFGHRPPSSRAILGKEIPLSLVTMTTAAPKPTTRLGGVDSLPLGVRVAPDGEVVPVSISKRAGECEGFREVVKTVIETLVVPLEVMVVTEKENAGVTEATAAVVDGVRTVSIEERGVSGE